jgi:hemolysin activation/secretion protein
LAHAQTASQITPKTFAPPTVAAPGGGLAIVGGAGLETPAGAEKLSVTLSGVTVSGGFPELADAQAALVAKLARRKVTGAEIFAAARELEAAYARAGYVLVRVGLPPQKLVNGAALKLIVVDGAVERVETKDAPAAVAGRLHTLLDPLIGKRHLQIRELERRVLLAGDVPGVLIRSTLAPGSADGGTVLVIEVKYQPIDATVTADNSLSRQLGRWQTGLGFDLNSVLGFGELSYVRVSADPIGGNAGFLSEDARNRSLAAGFIVPLPIDGLSFNAEGTQARVSPLAVAPAPAATDLFERLSLRLRYAFIRSRDFNLTSQLVFDAQDEHQALLQAYGGTSLSLDRLRVLRVTNDADYLAAWGGSVTGSLNLSTGLDAFGARTGAEAAASLVPLSRQGAGASFTKLDGALGYTQNFAEHLSTTLSARAQTSFGQALERAEQIGIAGPGSLSAFNAGQLQGDSGAVARAELGAPFVLPANSLPFSDGTVGILATPYAFVSAGEIFLVDPTILESSHVRAASYGGGLRIAGGKAGALGTGSLGLEFSREARSDKIPDGNRFTLVTAIKF